MRVCASMCVCVCACVSVLACELTAAPVWSVRRSLDLSRNMIKNTDRLVSLQQLQELDVTYVRAVFPVSVTCHVSLSCVCVLLASLVVVAAAVVVPCTPLVFHDRWCV